MTLLPRKRRVLIVEDDPQIIKLHSLFLERDGYEPVPAQGGQEALCLLEDTEVDLILLDLMMPEMDGWTVLRAVRENERLRQVPVIVVTVVHPHEDWAEVSSHADLFDSYYVKPFGSEDLMDQIRKLLG